MGACVDYSIHYLSELYFGNRSKTNKIIFYKTTIRPISIGALTSIIAFIALYFGNFTGLSEISLFAIAGLFGSYLSVILFIPFIEQYTKIDPNNSFPGIANYFFKLPNLILRKENPHSYFITATILLVALVGILNMKTNDDLRLLQTPNQSLLENEKQISSLLGKGSPIAYLVSSASSLELAQELDFRSERTLANLAKTDPTLKYDSYSTYIPPLSERRKNLEIYRTFLSKHATKLTHLLEEIGYSKILIEKTYAVNTNQLSDFELPSSMQRLLNSLLINPDNTNYSLIIPVFDALSFKPLKRLADVTEGIKLIHIRPEIENAFASYRSKSIQMTLFSYTFILLLLMYLYGIYEGFIMFLPSVATVILTLSTISILGFPVNFFSILALIIVLGLCIDYAVFYKEEQSNAAKVSVLLSSITTIITFGILSYSSAPILKSFGVVISFGVIYSQFFSALPYASTSKDADYKT